ncbi:uncharacterized protein LOC106659340 isoform X3 [Trichogramma pretiosum]|uniref:uncharacterized protein LOC106659340 isoform X3 n=1 Tax=Trichogramma pretiosum TaxID=7493 RepID=UPI0006C9A52C|nr:uncharacterized protein LOC106659340 isoform X3 [Trichogramma pretiosum]
MSSCSSSNNNPSAPIASAQASASIDSQQPPKQQQAQQQPSAEASSPGQTQQQQQHFSLVWNTFPHNLSTGLYSLLTGEQLVDVTLAAEGQILRAHKLILSVCSTYFRDLFKEEVDSELTDALPLIHHDRGNDNLTPSQRQGTTAETSPGSLDMSHHQQHQQHQHHTASWQNVNNNAAGCSCNNVKAAIKVEDVSITSYKEQQHRHHHRRQSQLGDSTKSARRQQLDNDDMDEGNDDDDDDENEEEVEEEEEEEQPLDCSSTPDHVQQAKITAANDYKSSDVLNMTLGSTEIRHLTPEVECIQRGAASLSGSTAPHRLPIPYTEQDHMDSLLNAQMLSAAYCPGNSVGFHDTGTAGGTSSSSLAEFNSAQQAAAAAATASSGSVSSKGRRTVKGLPGSSLSLETTLRVISELGPTIRMERGKVIRMYSCPWCLRHFTRKENLKLHVRYIHGPLESLTCKLCGNKYKNSNSLRVHSYLYHNAQRNKSSSAGAAAAAGSSAAETSGKPPVVRGNV